MKVPSLNRINNILIFLILVTVVLFYAQQVLVILAFSMVLAMLMTPVSNRLERFGMSRVAASLLCLIIVLIIFAGIGFIVALEITNIAREFTVIQKKFMLLADKFQLFLTRHFGITSRDQTDFFENQGTQLLDSAGKYVKNIVVGMTGTLASLGIILVFIFLLLLHREKYVEFILKIYKRENEEETRMVLAKIARISQSYFYGRLISIVFLTVFYFVGLAIIGLKNALLLSVIASLLTIVPYIGPVLGGIFPFTMAIVSFETFIGPLMVIGVIFIAQVFDNYFIEPYVVGGEVSISPFFTILILITGGILWGIPGVILFLPLLGMIKIICDHVPELKPYGYLIGNQGGSKKLTTRWKDIFNKKKQGTKT